MVETVIATTLFITFILLWVGFGVGVCVAFYKYMKWILPKIKKGENPFPGVTPFQGIILWKYLGSHHDHWH